MSIIKLFGNTEMDNCHNGVLFLSLLFNWIVFIEMKIIFSLIKTFLCMVVNVEVFALL